jgi:Ca2+-binding RTX toxin-like protein
MTATKRWLRSWDGLFARRTAERRGGGRVRRIGRRDRARPAVEQLEERTLLTNSTVGAAGLLTVNLTFGDDVAVTCVTGKVKLNGANPDTGSANCSAITQIDINGGTLGNTINLSGVTTNNGFTGMTGQLPVTVDGGAGDDSIRGSGFADSLLGGIGDDTVVGNFGADKLDGGSGNDFLDGGAGNDTLDGDSGNDSINGGADTDRVVIVTLVGNLTITNTQSTGEGTDTLVSIEEATLTDDNEGPISRDILDASQFSGPAKLSSFDGEDTLIGGPNNDELFCGVCGVNGALLQGGGGDDTLSGFSNSTLDGGSGIDTVIETLSGGETLTLTDSQLAFGSGGTATLVSIEMANFFPVGAASSVNINASGFSGSATVTGTPGPDTLIGGSGPDSILGGDGNDSIRGNGGNDTLRGEAGADSITGGAGADSIDGGTGTDRLVESGLGNTTLTAGTLTELNTVDTLAGIEAASLTAGQSPVRLDASAFTGPVTLVGGVLGDTVIGGSGADSLDGGSGNDFLTGGLGNDTLNGNGGTGDRVVEAGDVNFSFSNATTLVGLGTDTLAGVELVQLSGGPTGNSISASNFSGSAILDGAGGGDSLFGTDSDDTITGGPGNDAIIGNNGTDTIVESGNVNFTLTDATLTGNGSDSLTSIERAKLTGGASGNTINASGFNGLTTLDGGAGDDSIMGGNSGDLILGGDGNDSINAAVGDDEVDGDAGDDEITGSSGSDSLRGGSGNDTLNGGAGDDTLLGESGNDQLDDTSGTNTLNGGDDCDVINIVLEPECAGTPGVTVTQSGGATNLNESGGNDSYTIVLTGQPTADVTIVATTNAQLTVVSPAFGVLVFTPANFDVPQTVTLAAVDDAVSEGTHTGVATHFANSTDSRYQGIDVADVIANITDNDVPAVLISQSGGSTNVGEDGTTDTYTVRLSTVPTANVMITITPAAPLDTSPTSLVFTPANFATEQTVTVRAADDFIDQGNRTGTIQFSASSADPGYNNIVIPSVSPTIIDDDTAGVTIAQSGGSTNVAEGGATDTYTIVLASQPTADVTININPGSQATVSPTSVNFTAANFGTPQTITVTAVNDAVAEGNHSDLIQHTASSADAKYNGNSVTIDKVTANITDNDSAGVIVTESGGFTAANEGSTDTYTIALTSQPTSNVTINLATTGPANVSPASLVFTPANFATPQTVTVTAADDQIDQGDRAAAVQHTATSSDTNYDGFSLADIDVTVVDNDVAGVTISQTSGSTQVVESGATDVYSIVLNTQPNGNVTVNISPDSQVIVSAASLTFTPGNFNTPQNVTVTAVNDTAAEGPHTGTITHSATSADPAYSGAAVTIASVTAQIADNDTPGVLITETGGSTNVAEGGAGDSYQVVLLTQPTDNVTITVAANSQLTENPTTLIFTPGNFSTSQTVNVSAVDDALGQGNRTTQLTHSAASTDANYRAIAIAPLNVAITDNDPPDVTPPTVTDVTFVAAGTTITAIVLQFSEPLDPQTAVDPANYANALRGAGKDKRLGTADDTFINFAVPAYDDSLRTVRLTPNTPLAANVFFQVTALGTTSIKDLAGNKLDGNRDGTEGDDFIASFARGTKLAFLDRDNDKVSLKIKGGVLELVRRADGQAETVRAIRSGAAAATLSGSVKLGTGGNGAAVISSLRGVVGTGITNNLRTPPFQFGVISAKVVDRLLETGSL